MEGKREMLKMVGRLLEGRKEMREEEGWVTEVGKVG